MNFPDFLIIGAAKAGTTSLYHYLQQHPEIEMSKNKEPAYFVYKNIRPNNIPKHTSDGYKNQLCFTLNKYINNFFYKDGAKKRGENSNEYLYSKYAPKEIYKYNPNIKLIVILRNPVERAYSHYLMNVRSGRETLSFRDALKKEKYRIINNYAMGWHYKNVGLYYDQLIRFYNLFDSKNIKVYIFDNFFKNTIKELQSLYKYIGVNENFVPNIEKKYFVSKNIPYQYIINNIENVINFRPISYLFYKLVEIYDYNIKPKIKVSIKKQLKDYYIQEIEKLEYLTNFSLNEWK